MKVGYQPKIAIALLVLSVGLFFLSGQVGQVSASSYTPRGCYSYYSYYPYYYNMSYYDYYGYYPYNYYYYGDPYSYSSCYGSYGYQYNDYYYYGYPYYSYSYYSYSTPSKYQLTVSTDPSDLGTATGAGTFTQGTSASFSITKSIVQTSSNTRYVFSHWTGDYSGVGASGTITMNSVKKVTAVSQLQYYLSVGVQPQNAPVPQGEGWYNAGDTTVLSVTGQMLGGQDDSRLVFQGWNVDGQNLQGLSLSLKMDGPHFAAAQYKQQYYVKVLSDQGVPYGEGWYDAGSTAQVYVSTPISTQYGVSIVFNGWQGDLKSSSQSSSLLVDSPKTVIASWRSDPTVLNYTIIAGVIIAVLIVAAVVAYAALGRRRNNSWRATPPPQQPALKPVQVPNESPASKPMITDASPVKKMKEVPHSQEPEADTSKTE
jgi:hypothetical protein